jgi:hypothetical protein
MSDPAAAAFLAAQGEDAGRAVLGPSHARQLEPLAGFAVGFGDA